MVVPVKVHSPVASRYHCLWLSWAGLHCVLTATQSAIPLCVNLAGNQYTGMSLNSIRCYGCDDVSPPLTKESLGCQPPHQYMGMSLNSIRCYRCDEVNPPFTKESLGSQPPHQYTGMSLNSIRCYGCDYVIPPFTKELQGSQSRHQHTGCHSTPLGVMDAIR